MRNNKQTESETLKLPWYKKKKDRSKNKTRRWSWEGSFILNLQQQNSSSSSKSTRSPATYCLSNNGCSNNMLLVNVWICLMIMISQQEPSLKQNPSSSGKSFLLKRICCWGEFQQEFRWKFQWKLLFPHKYRIQWRKFSCCCILLTIWQPANSKLKNHVFWWKICGRIQLRKRKISAIFLAFPVFPFVTSHTFGSKICQAVSMDFLGCFPVDFKSRGDLELQQNDERRNSWEQTAPVNKTKRLKWLFVSWGLSPFAVITRSPHHIHRHAERGPRWDRLRHDCHQPVGRTRPGCYWSRAFAISRVCKERRAKLPAWS